MLKPPSDDTAWIQNAERVLARLAPFQRRTAEYVVSRLYDPVDPARRFLVADEVGLGKTWVAKGVIAEVIRHRRVELGDPRVDIVYVCPNAQIANQNVDHLEEVTQGLVVKETRLPLLAARTAGLEGRAVNLVCITPGTSGLSGAVATGSFEERALISAVARELFADVRWTANVERVFHYGVKDLGERTPRERMARKIDRLFRVPRESVETARPSRLEAGRLRSNDSLVVSLRRIVTEDDRRRRRANPSGRAKPVPFEYLPRREQLIELRDNFRDVPDGGADVRLTRRQADWKLKRSQFISDFRNMLAHAAIRSLKPDLVILDEFQRFGYLLASGEGGQIGDPDTTSADAVELDLARQLFASTNNAMDDDPRVLLLSATPFRSFGRGAEGSIANPELNRTVRFLKSQAVADEVNQLVLDAREAMLEAASGALQSDSGGRAQAIDRAAEACAQLGAALRPLMVRTERIALTGDRDAMLRDMASDRVLTLEAEDVAGFHDAASFARAAGVGDIVEYWKSAPYPLAFMSGYALWRRIDDALSKRQASGRLPAIVDAIGKATGELDSLALERFDEIVWPHEGFRRLVDDVFVGGSEHWLWMPPSLCYYVAENGPCGQVTPNPYTKRIVFSSWTLAPKMLAALLSYEHERRVRAAIGVSKLARPRLDFPTIDRGTKRPAGLHQLLLVAPWGGLARFGDSRPFVSASEQPGLMDVLSTTAAAIELTLGDFVRAAPGSASADPAWYWVGPALLDVIADGETARSVGRSNLGWWIAAEAETWTQRVMITDEPDDERGRSDDDHAAGLAQHVSTVRDAVIEWSAMARTELIELIGARFGAPPDDLFDVLAMAAVGSPAICALRSFRRRALERELAEANEQAGDAGNRDEAARLAWGFRSLFMNDLAGAVVAGREAGNARSYWREVLRYSADCHLQAVLDEYIHVLRSWVKSSDVVGRATAAVRVGDARLKVRTVNPDGTDPVDVLGGVRQMPMVFASTFGSDENVGSEQSISRLQIVSNRFNSPFWPFVMATTSIGQEGLDFHLYSHAVVHWNLPPSPVDLEQREGRIQRRHGHAIRKNLALDYRRHISGDAITDPWAELFTAAENDLELRGLTAQGMVPHWVYSPSAEHAKIERYARYFPYSKEERRFEQLMQELTTYRLTFGQPRQDDLLQFLRASIEQDDLEAIAQRLRVDLGPPEVNRSRRGE